MRLYVVAFVIALFSAAEASAATITYSGSGFPIPDNDAGGASSVISVPDGGVVTDVSLTIAFEHGFVGDLIVTLSHGSATVDILHRVGKPNSALGGDSSDVSGLYTFTDSATDDFALTAGLGGAMFIIPSGTYRSSTNIFSGDPATTNPFTSLNAAFGGLDASGDWILFVSDTSAFDLGSISSWSLTLTTPDVAAAVPEPASLTLLGTGALSLAGAAWRRHKRRA